MLQEPLPDPRPAGYSGDPWPDDDPQGPPGVLLGTVLRTVIGEDGAGLPRLSDGRLPTRVGAGERQVHPRDRRS